MAVNEHPVSARTAAGRIFPGMLVLAAMASLAAPAAAQTLGFVQTFAGTGTKGWTSFNVNSNPGTGGVDGDGDGFLSISQFPDRLNFGSHNDGLDYAGNWTAAGITQVAFYLNDINTDEQFSFHFLVTGDEGSPDGECTYQFNRGFDPPNGSWQQYFVDLTNPADWTRIRGTSSLADVLADVADAHFRHDLEPYITPPNPIAGDIGIDNIALLPSPGTLPVLALVGLASLRRRGRA